ncbi:MAG TPA: PIN domain-containing protein [Bryobacteraceae bacterium]|nr:PIN domain-containing protein [Bryobacteraceae bacterium]
MTKDYVAVLDACVIVPAGLRDTLLRLAETPRLYLPKWSDEILAEVRRTLIGKLRKTESQADHLIEELRNAFPEACLKACKELENALINNHKDRHVLATAIRSSAQTIVTFNLRHFPPEALQSYDVQAVHPDEFLVHQFHLDEAVVVRKFAEQAEAIGRTIEQQLNAFHQSKDLPLFTQTLADALRVKIG